MLEDLNSTFKIIGLLSLSGVSILGIVTYLFQKIFEKYVDRKMEQFKNKLQLEIESFKTILDTQKSKRLIVFSNLYLESANSIKTLYSELVELEQDFHYINTSKSDQNITVLSERIKEINRMTLKQKLFLTSEISSAINIIIDLSNQQLSLIKDEIAYRQMMERSLLSDGSIDIDYKAKFQNINTLKIQISIETNKTLSDIDLLFKKMIGFEEL